MRSDALRCTQMHSDALRCNQMQSDALTSWMRSKPYGPHETPNAMQMVTNGSPSGAKS